MIAYSIDVYSKETEDLLFEVEIPESEPQEVTQIMGLNEEDKFGFSLGIGVYDINEDQARLLENLLNKEFYSSDRDLQLSGGNIKS